ncbi:hypothetical protein VTJ04DRAFT_7001 [Mycothermus thermophilus]|uniref:uncharacterized protein n=1 Tax=Humicola insolens TaxID=85995 RepID=UPI0037433D6E
MGAPQKRGPHSRTPSPSPSRQITRQPRPVSASAATLSGSCNYDERSRPTVLADRWSYDRQRMPSPPPVPRPAAYAYSVSACSSRPGTPVSPAEHAGFSSRPASTHFDSAPPSRPHSMVFSAADAETRPPTPALPLTHQGGAGPPLKAAAAAASHDSVATQETPFAVT